MQSTPQDQRHDLQPPELIIFDCDGVLVDSEVLAVAIESRVLTEAGFPMTIDDVAETCVGLSYGDMMALLGRRFGRPVPESLNEEIQVKTLASFPEQLRPIPGIQDLLLASKTARCVASSSDPDRIRLSLGLTGLSDHFTSDAVFSATMVENGKPAPDLFLHAAASLGYRPDRCLVVEDSPHGVAAAIAAGMDVVGFVGGGHARPSLVDRLLAAGAETVTESHWALARLLGHAFP